MEDLPDELLLQILDLLPDSNIINVVPRVCLRWSRLSLDSHIWKNRTCVVGPGSDSEFIEFFSRKPALRSVNFYHEINEDVLRSLASHCRTITSLGLKSEPLTLDTLRLITHNCDQIRDLRINSEVFSCLGNAREVALMPRLETLTVHGWEPLQLSELGAGCARLRHLDLIGAENFRLGDLGAPLLRRLQGLSIQLKFVSSDIVHCAESLEKITLPNYSRLWRLDSALAEDLLALKSLKALTHVDTYNLYASRRVIRSLMQPLLRSLHLCCCRHLTNKLLLELCRRCPLLEDLDLSECTLISARGLSSLWSLRRLQRLDLDFCINLGSGAMTHLARCDGLQELHMLGVSMHCMGPKVSQLLELNKLRYLAFDAWSARDLISWEMFPTAFPELRTLHLGDWETQDKSLPESLKAAMQSTRVEWSSP